MNAKKWKPFLIQIITLNIHTGVSFEWSRFVFKGIYSLSCLEEKIVIKIAGLNFSKGGKQIMSLLILVNRTLYGGFLPT